MNWDDIETLDFEFFGTLNDCRFWEVFQYDNHPVHSIEYLVDWELSA